MKRKHKLDKSILFKGFLKDLTTRYGMRTAAVIWEEANRELERLETGHPNAERRDLAMVFPAVALYRAIEKNVPGDALEATRAYGTKVGQKYGNILRKVTALPGMPSLIWKKMPAIAKKMTDGYECEDVIVDDQHCSLRITGCPMYNRAGALDCPEAAQLICCLDKEYLNGFRGIEYTRNRSLAEGDAYCDYLLVNSRCKTKNKDK